MMVSSREKQPHHSNESKSRCHRKASSQALLPRSDTVRPIFFKFRRLAHEAVPHHFHGWRPLEKSVNLSQHQAMSIRGFVKLYSHLVSSIHEVVDDQLGQIGEKRGSVKVFALAKTGDFDIRLVKLQWLVRARPSHVLQGSTRECGKSHKYEFPQQRQ